MYTWFIARRLFSHSGDAKKVSRPAVIIATAGVAVGVAVMILSVCVVLGFKWEIQQKVLGFGSHIQVLNYESIAQGVSMPIVINDEVESDLMEIPGVRHLQRFCTKSGMLKTPESFRGVTFRGIGPDYDVSFLQEHLVDGHLPAFSDTTSTGGMLISQRLAQQLMIKSGDDIYAYFFEQSVRARRFTVCGIFSTNLTDFDNAIVYVDLYTVKSLFKWDSEQYSGAEIALDDFSKVDEVAAQVASKINHTQDAYGAYYTSPTIRELYPQIFSWLDLLDMDVLVILVLMICLSGFTMISGLLIIILERTNFIGVMKALGASNGSIRHLFLYFAVFIILRGLVVGNLIAFAIILVQQHFGLVHLNPEIYYVSTVPLQVNATYIIIINLATLLISLLALILPSYIVSNIHPARSIRFE
ncbi:MAG: ABC transporter permease [Bacteroidaceae bacterium]|nr:ABC transporter permease [Bacteroidaceae bacterium]